MRRMVMFVGVALAGCTLGHTDVLAGGGPEPDAGQVMDGGSDDGSSSFDGGVNLAGTWAQLLVYGTVFNLPAIGQTEGETTTVLHVSIAQEAGSLRVDATTCSVEIDNGTEIVDTIIPDRFIESLVVQQPSTKLERDGDALRYHQERVLTLRGVRLDDPESDALPTEATDPRVFDQDEDGRPGMTVLVKGITDGEVYVIQRDWYALAGQAKRADWIDGLAEWGTEQVVLGSDNEILNAQTESSPHPEQARSYFLMTRVTDQDDCASILAQRDVLFERE
ncbi:MAG: hypothetical protein ACOC1F_03600 [Myxococcota bacterium]